MTRNLLIVLLWWALSVAPVAAQTVIPGGSVSGTWTALGSPYLIQGNISVTDGSVLMIQPGVMVIFQGNYSLKIFGCLQAVGTASDFITFTAAYPNTGWKGVRFEFADSTSIISYCILEYGKPPLQHPDGRGGAIYCWYSDPTISHCTLRYNLALDGGGISCYFSSPIISDCDIMYNTADQGGGIRCKLSSNALISNCRINHNTALFRGGGINIIDDSQPTIRYCEIAGNEAGDDGGGVGCFNYAAPVLSNCTISANEAQSSGDGLYSFLGSPDVINCIFWNNGQQEIIGSAEITYSDVQGGWAGMGNINADPLFVNATTFDFHLQENSPCIDAGDPYSPIDPDSSLADMGAYYHHHPSPFLQTSASSLNFGVVHIDSTAALPLTIYNRGIAPLIIYDVVSNFPVFSTNFDPGDSTIVPGDSLELAVTFAPEDSTYYTASLQIESNHVPTEIQLLGIGFFPTPVIVVSDTLFDFEAVARDSNAYLPLTIGNTGSGDVIVSQIISTHPAFYTTFNSADSLIAPGDSLNLQIVCNSDSGGILDEYLYVQANVDTVALHVKALVGNTYVPAGNVSGVWTSANSPYVVFGQITVPSGAELIIEPGVTVIFNDHYKLQIEGSLQAVGTWSDSIKFMPDNNEIGWHGLRFISAADTSRLKYCHITQGKAYVVTWPIWEDARGGGLYCSNSNLRVEYCSIDYCQAEGASNIASGGGLFIDDVSHAWIDFCNISHNTCGSDGGGIYASSNTIISNCILSHNLANQGGGIYCEGNPGTVVTHCLLLNNWSNCAGGGIRFDYAPTVTIEYCTFIGNSCGLGGGGLGVFFCDPVISNCLFYGNHAENSNWNYGGGGLDFSGSNGTLLNCTVVGNSTNASGGGIKTNSDTHILNCIVRDNSASGGSSQIAGGLVTYCNVEGGYAGVGNLDRYPAYVDSALHDFRLQWGSPCIDVGDPRPEYNNPDGTRSDIGAFFYDQSTPARILLTPQVYPLLAFPPGGGNFDFTARVTNIDPLTPQIELWTELTLPDGRLLTPVLGPMLTVLDSGSTYSRILGETIPPNAPGGTYTYSIYAVAAGDTSADSFTFYKLGVRGVQDYAGWLTSGELLAGMTTAGDNLPLPEEYSLNPNYPNPFNSSTILRYQMPAAGHVNLKVYDVSGRMVSNLVNGWRAAGMHDVTFDGSNLASGIYLARFEAGTFTAVQKLILLK